MRAAARISFGLFVLAAQLPGITRAHEPETQRFAIVIGTNQPAADGVATLQYADDDALRTHELLSEAGVSSVVLVRLDATSQALRPHWKPDGLPRIADFERAYERVRGKIQQARSRGDSAEFWLFYSGHGDVEHGEGFLTLEDQRLTRSLLYARLSALQAHRQHVVIDACRSYFMAYDRGVGGKREAFAGSTSLASAPAQLRNTGFILSTSSDRESHEWERYEAGILSHEVHSALRGAADANSDSTISYLELAAFLHQANREIKNPRFRPEFTVRAPGDDFERALLAWPRAASALHVPAPGWDHFFIETAEGDRVLDANPDPTQVLRLHVPESRPLYVMRNDLKGQQVISEPGAAEIAPPRATSPTALARSGAIEIAFERLFEASFGQPDVQAFRPHALAVTRSLAAEAKTDRSGSAWFGTSLFWVGIGIAAVGGAVLTSVLVAGQQPEAAPAYGGTTGVSIGGR